MHEFEFIDKIKCLAGNYSPKSKNIGIGDDCAILTDISDTKDVLVTTDILAEGVHFDLSYCSFYDVGYKSAQVNISDMISKGGRPSSVFVSISIPETIKEKDVIEWYNGFLYACNPFAIEIAGGDTTKSKSGFFISITLIGTVDKQRSVLRSGAKVKDSVYVLGRLGESDIGLKRLLSGIYSYNDECVKTHLRPKLFYDEWVDILNTYKVNSSIDVSDGLLQDVSHIAESSSVHINVFKSSNWHRVNRAYKDDNSFNILKSIVSGGEDYSIVFSSEYEIEEDENLIKIGYIDRLRNGEEENCVSFLDEKGKEIGFTSGGFSHF